MACHGEVQPDGRGRFLRATSVTTATPTNAAWSQGVLQVLPHLVMINFLSTPLENNNNKHTCMKHYTPNFILLAAAAVLVGSSQAATVVAPYDNSTGPADDAFLYGSKITFTTTDSYATSASPGAWSYRDLKPAADPNKGWGHTSAWYLVELGTDAYFSVTLTSADVNAQPGFVIYKGESLIDTPGSAHTYSNNGNDIATLNSPWDQNGAGGAPGLVYQGSAFVGSTASLSGSYFLPAGLYTVAVGNAANSLSAPPAVTYGVAFATVPEPSTSLLGVLGLVGGLRRRRRA